MTETLSDIIKKQEDLVDLKIDTLIEYFVDLKENNLLIESSKIEELFFPILLVFEKYNFDKTPIIIAQDRLVELINETNINLANNIDAAKNFLYSHYATHFDVQQSIKESMLLYSSKVLDTHYNLVSSLSKQIDEFSKSSDLLINEFSSQLQTSIAEFEKLIKLLTQKFESKAEELNKSFHGKNDETINNNLDALQEIKNNFIINYDTAVDKINKEKESIIKEIKYDATDIFNFLEFDKRQKDNEYINIKFDAINKTFDAAILSSNVIDINSFKVDLTDVNDLENVYKSTSQLSKDFNNISKSLSFNLDVEAEKNKLPTLNIKFDYDKFDEIFNKKNKKYKNKVNIAANRFEKNLTKNMFEFFWDNNFDEIKLLLDTVKQTIKDTYNKLEIERKRLHQLLLKDINNQPHRHFFGDVDEYYDFMSYWDLEDPRQQIAGILGRYVNWAYPIAYFDPNNSEFLRLLISGDPLYYIDDKKGSYDRAVKKLPDGKKLRYYSYNDAEKYLENESILLSVCWNSFPFVRVSEIRQKLKLMTQLTKPGGYIIFNYADASTSVGANIIEKYRLTFLWKEFIAKLVKDCQLEIVYDKTIADNSFNVVVCHKPGAYENLSLVNKVGLVLPNKKDFR